MKFVVFAVISVANVCVVAAVYALVVIVVVGGGAAGGGSGGGIVLDDDNVGGVFVLVLEKCRNKLSIQIFII